MVLTKKYKGNTLIEVLIAIVIMSFTSAFGVSIYINIQENSMPFLKLKASDIANYCLKETEKANNYFDKSFNEEGFSLKKTITHSDVYPDCIILKISVSNNKEKKLCEIQKLIHAD